jgi:hypothetical protein
MVSLPFEKPNASVEPLNDGILLAHVTCNPNFCKFSAITDVET